MKIFRTLEDINFTNPVVTVGTFDGVHKGHMEILDSLKSEAKKIGGESVVFTLYPHPRKVLRPSEKELFLLNTIDEKTELLKKAGIDNLIIYPFTLEFAKLSSCNFIEKILYKKIRLKQLIVGFDHHFGKDRQGNLEILRNCADPFGFEIKKVEALEDTGKKISSSWIRTLITDGKIVKANEYLDYEYFIKGLVVSGEKLGRTMGFPTANIKVIEKEKLIPKRGVYAVKIKLDSREYEGMLNIGIRPTVSSNFETKIEVHIFNFSGDLYNKTLKIKFINFIRDEIKFADKNHLKAQLISDKETALSLLSKYHS